MICFTKYRLIGEFRLNMTTIYENAIPIANTYKTIRWNKLRRKISVLSPPECEYEKNISNRLAAYTMLHLSRAAED